LTEENAFLETDGPTLAPSLVEFGDSSLIIFSDGISMVLQTMFLFIFQCRIENRPITTLLCAKKLTNLVCRTKIKEIKWELKVKRKNRSTSKEIR